MTKIVIPSNVVALLERTRDALAGATERKALPRWLPNGEEIETIPQLAAVLCVDEKTAAHCVMSAYNPSPVLVKEARATITRQTKGRSVRIIRDGTARHG